jgi:hypothetical protein
MSDQNVYVNVFAKSDDADTSREKFIMLGFDVTQLGPVPSMTLNVEKANKYQTSAGSTYYVVVASNKT